MAMICEDDLSMVFKPTQSQLVQCTRNAPKDWELIQLYSFAKDHLPRRMYTENMNKNHFDSPLCI